jgi:glycerol-3-phosphate dehydrogenase (NAD(P)+)
MPSFWVLGAGAWGTALGIVLARNRVEVTLWDHDEALMRVMRDQNENGRYLSGIPFPPSLKLASSFPKSLPDNAILLIAVPSHAFREVLQRCDENALFDHVAGVSWATKGLESQHGGLLHCSVDELTPQGTPTALISGPSFAFEVASGLPTALTIASETPTFLDQLLTAFHQPMFRPYGSDDIIGVEVGGAVKNVLAIAAGIADGMKLGANARAGLITRGLVEMTRLGIAMGAQAATFRGLSGLGDLMLTATDDQSRNRQLGLQLGQNKTKEEAFSIVGATVEGVRTADEVYQLAQAHHVDMPICEQVYAVLYQGVPPAEAMQRLLNRPLKSEDEIF